MTPSIEFPVSLAWGAIQILLAAQLDDNISVDCIGEKDFDEQGAVTIIPPAARVLFVEENAGPEVGTQGTAYNTTQSFAVICADEDVGPDPQDQRLKSLCLVDQVKHILTGARLVLDSTVTPPVLSEPVLFLGASPLQTAGTGLAYMVGFSVRGIAQFAAPNAYPDVEGGD